VITRTVYQHTLDKLKEARDRIAELEAELADTQSNLSFIIDYTTSERERKALRRIRELEDLICDRSAAAGHS